MEYNRSAIKERAKANFKAQYWPVVGWTLLASLLISVCMAIPVTSLILAPVLTAGLSWFSLKVYRGETVNGGEDIFVGFQNFGHVLGGMLWMELFTFLWSLLFIVPGIIKGLSYSMTPYILIDQPEIGACDALKLSMQMTKGYKGRIFVMGLSFIGWAILTSLTFGILGIFYTEPYMNVSFSGIYEEIKKNYVPAAEAE